ncbi:MAG: hypothetical protein ABSE22_20090 [Xanthobacteraceae bacterium]|jgi:hypothetical protein
MRDNEFLRQKREREFQARLLAAVEKPKRRTFWELLNSGFVLWLLSVVLLSVGGGYISNHQQCMKDADTIIAQRFPLQEEIIGRQAVFLTAVQNTKHFQEAPAHPDELSPSTRGSSYSFYSNASYLEVMDHFSNWKRRIDRDEFPDPRFNSEGLRQLEGILFSRRYALIFPTGKESEDELNNLLLRRRLAAQVMREDSDFHLTLDNAHTYRTSCSPYNTVMEAMGYEMKIVVAYVPSSIHLDSFISALTYEKDRIEANLQWLRQLGANF